MLFHDYAFVFLFLPAVLLAHGFAPAPARNAILFAASVVFYAASSFVFLPLVLLSSLVDFVAGGRIGASADTKTRKRWLAFAITANLGLLGYFKYVGLFTRTLHDGLGLSGVPIIEAALPVGISFYTFQTMSYSIDVYRGVSRPTRSYFDFGAFVTLFPQLIAGPIVRFHDIADQLRQRTLTTARFTDGVFLYVLGLGKKLLLADLAGGIADPIFARGASGSGEAWLAIVLYSAQIYFDFSAYSDMAIGLGRMLGFELPRNFDSPYKAQSFSEFWRRWHITLSEWLRDNLYIPLGGNRLGPGRTYLNLIATMLLGGLWHGASWNFVVWGGLHGAYLAIERRVGGASPLRRAPAFVRIAVVYVAVLVAWVFFRIDGLTPALDWLRAMLTWPMGQVDLRAAGFAAALLVIMFGLPNTAELDRRPTPLKGVAVAALFVAALFVGYGRGISPFLYYRF
ncbi:hypothetical protein L6R52_32755 [Myxococcota bacterium]|nr:hypothetical protein [Myxococcota bacterium]